MPSAVLPGQTQQTRQTTNADPALPRSVLCLPGMLGFAADELALGFGFFLSGNWRDAVRQHG
jgi:hypothetical protein